MHFRRYRGGSIDLPGGPIQHGDSAGEIHLNNQVLVAALGAKTGATKWPIMSMMRDELTALAAWVESDRFPHPIAGI